MSLEIDLHGYHPDDLDRLDEAKESLLTKIVRRAWEMGEPVREDELFDADLVRYPASYQPESRAVRRGERD